MTIFLRTVTIMKRSLLLTLCLTLVVAATGPVGCQKKPKNPTPIPTAYSGVRSTDGPFGPGSVSPVGIDDPSVARPLQGDDGTYALPLDDDTGMRRDESFFAANTVYFDFDRSTIRAGERTKIESVASHLNSNPTHKVKVEGHCDERGTEGYNLALGERRALSVREYLINLGISPDRIYTISWGEARPADPSRTETAYGRNRRGEFILLLP
jgi:peptidoglycan-associated lipoprotein